MGTRIPVRPKMRVGSGAVAAEAKTGVASSPVVKVWRNSRRFIMATLPQKARRLKNKGRSPEARFLNSYPYAEL